MYCEHVNVTKLSTDRLNVVRLRHWFHAKPQDMFLLAKGVCEDFMESQRKMVRQPFLLDWPILVRSQDPQSTAHRHPVA